ncbi:MSHA biogenesis protein MshP [Pseudoalteromonas ulvae UL12]|nr:agglutinin biogenesis protein MshP [Pseudoalteromonas ulvae]MBE0364912.1 MSHA biogenesis protein MshP [Pseudoalteromonas ulvae UL12]
MLLTALFVAILMLGLGLAVVKIISSSANNNAVEYYGARAFLAAQSGLERGLSEMFPLGGAPGTGNCPVTTNFDLISPALANCNVVLACEQVGPVPDFNLAPSGGVSQVSVYRLTSTATCKVNDCALGQACRKDFWQTQRSLSVEAKTLN